MDKFLYTYDHLKLNQEEIKHLNRSIIVELQQSTTKRKDGQMELDEIKNLVHNQITGL
jgi:hypothetical protein